MRPKLALKKRSKPVVSNATTSASPKSSSIFGEAKPRDESKFLAIQKEREERAAAEKAAALAQEQAQNAEVNNIVTE
jgi:hypothetical protein